MLLEGKVWEILWRERSLVIGAAAGPDERAIVSEYKFWQPDDKTWVGRHPSGFFADGNQFHIVLPRIVETVMHVESDARLDAFLPNYVLCVSDWLWATTVRTLRMWTMQEMVVNYAKEQPNQAAMLGSVAAVHGCDLETWLTGTEEY